MDWLPTLRSFFGVFTQGWAAHRAGLGDRGPQSLSQVQHPQSPLITHAWKTPEPQAFIAGLGCRGVDSSSDRAM